MPLSFPPPRAARRAAAALLLGSLLSACASPPHDSPSAEAPATAALPAAWQAPTPARPADEAALAEWWHGLGSAELDGLITQALAHNTDLRAAQATLRQARALRAATEAAAGPQLALGTSASRSQADGGTGANSFKLGFSASWEPDLWGATGAGVDAARADEQAAAADLASTRMALVAEVGLAHVQWRADLVRQQLTRASLQSLEETLALSRWNAQAGLASDLDVQQARQSTETTRASLMALDTQVAQDRHALALLTGQAPGALAAEPAESGLPTLEQALSGLATGVPADLLRRRPDLRSAEWAVQAAWLRREQARRAGWPGLSVSGTLGLQALTLAGLGQPGAALGTLAAAVDWTLFDGGQRRAQVEQQDALLARSRVAYEAALLSALKDVEDSLVALRGAGERQAALRQAREAADNALLLTRAQRQAGLTDVATLLTAQRTALTAELALVTARADQAANLIRTWKALGGGWDTHATTPATR